jgi:hypothetical protein
MNPYGRVPVINDDGTIVWESQTILRYLAATHGPGRFWSDDPGGNLVLPLFRDRHRTPIVAQRRGVVPPPPGSGVDASDCAHYK